MADINDLLDEAREHLRNAEWAQKELIHEILGLFKYTTQLMLDAYRANLDNRYASIALLEYLYKKK